MMKPIHSVSLKNKNSKTKKTKRCIMREIRNTLYHKEYDSDKNLLENILHRNIQPKKIHFLGILTFIFLLTTMVVNY